MLYDCDALSPARDTSPRWVSCIGNPFPLGEELQVFLATPGFLPQHFTKLFYWSHMTISAVRKARPTHLEAEGRANAATITLEDGLRLLELVGWARSSLPYWSVLAVRDTPEAVVMDRFGVDRARVQVWRTSRYWSLGGYWQGTKAGW